MTSLIVVTAHIPYTVPPWWVGNELPNASPAEREGRRRGEGSRLWVMQALLCDGNLSYIRVVHLLINIHEHCLTSLVRIPNDWIQQHPYVNLDETICLMSCLLHALRSRLWIMCATWHNNYCWIMCATWHNYFELCVQQDTTTIVELCY